MDISIGDKVQYNRNTSGDVDVENFMLDSKQKVFTVVGIERDEMNATGLFWVKDCEYGLDFNDFIKVG